MGLRFDPHWRYRGLECLRLENEHVALEILPELGAKIHRIVDNARDHDVLWHARQVAPHIAPLGSNAARRGFGLTFEREVFPVVWLWASYRGWREAYQTFVEPWTDCPSSLADAAASGRARVLTPGEALETALRPSSTAASNPCPACRPAARSRPDGCAARTHR
jgi:hypothetical protein